MGIKYAVDSNFFKTWNPKMAYVLGYLYADGSLEDASYLRGKYIRVTSIDQETIKRIRAWMGSEHTIVALESDQAHPGKTRYFLRIGDQTIYDDLVALGLYPNKSLTVRLPKIPEDFLADFVRGYFDGDGCVHLATAPGVVKERIIKKLSVIFASGSFDFLRSLCDTLREKLGLSQKNIYQGARVFQLRYSTNDSLKLFGFFYGNCLPGTFLERKFVIFRSYYDLRPSKANPGVSKIFDRLAT